MLNVSVDQITILALLCRSFATTRCSPAAVWREIAKRILPIRSQRDLLSQLERFTVWGIPSPRRKEERIASLVGRGRNWATLQDRCDIQILVKVVEGTSVNSGRDKGETFGWGKGENLGIGEMGEILFPVPLPIPSILNSEFWTLNSEF